jgi:hypothetical protein
MVTPVLMVSTRDKLPGISLLRKEVMKFANKPEVVKQKQKEEKLQRMIAKQNERSEQKKSNSEKKVHSDVKKDTETSKVSGNVKKYAETKSH